MARKQPFYLKYDEATKDHLRAIPAKYHSLTQAAIEEQLLFEPETETRNRKPLRQPAPFVGTPAGSTQSVPRPLRGQSRGSRGSNPGHR
jgi:hypothetical protein